MADPQFTNSTRQNLISEYINSSAFFTRQIVSRMMNENASASDYFCENYEKITDEPFVLFHNPELKSLLEEYVPKNKQSTFLRGANNSNKYKFAKEPKKRGLRTNDYSIRTREIYEYLFSYYQFGVFNCSLANFVRQKLSPQMLDLQQNMNQLLFFKGMHLDMMIAAEIDHSNAEEKKHELKTAIKQMLNESNAPALTADIVRGIFKSCDNELIDLVGKLLLAEQLPESVRETICENMDFGTPKAFIKIFKVIVENNLVRYPSVRQAAASWIGFFDKQAQENISQKTLLIMDECIANEKARANYLTSNNPTELTVALWGTGFYEELDVESPIKKIMQNGTRNQLLTISYFIQSMYDSSPYKSVTNYVLQNHPDDLELAAFFMPTYLSDIYPSICKMVYTCKQIIKLDIYKKFDCTDCLCDISVMSYFPASNQNAENHFEILTHLFSKLDKSEETFTSSVFPWHSASISKDMLASRICALAYIIDHKATGRLHTKRKHSQTDVQQDESVKTPHIDRAITYIQYATYEQQRLYLAVLLSPATRPEHRAFLFDMLKVPSIQKAALERLSLTTLTSAERKNNQSLLTTQRKCTYWTEGPCREKT